MHLYAYYDHDVVGAMCLIVACLKEDGCRRERFDLRKIDFGPWVTYPQKRRRRKKMRIRQWREDDVV